VKLRIKATEQRVDDPWEKRLLAKTNKLFIFNLIV